MKVTIEENYDKETKGKGCLSLPKLATFNISEIFTSGYNSQDSQSFC